MLSHLQASMNKYAQNYFAKTVQSAKGKRRHLGSMPEDSGSRYISQLFKPSESENGSIDFKNVFMFNIYSAMYENHL